LPALGRTYTDIPIQPIAKNALSILINLTSHDDEILHHLAEDDVFVQDLLKKLAVCRLASTEILSFAKQYRTPKTKMSTILPCFSAIYAKTLRYLGSQY
jgi:hypothetical protein